MSLINMFHNFDALFEEPIFRPLALSSRKEWMPRADIKEHNHNLLFEVELPGLCKENVDIEYDPASSTLSIKGEVKREEATQETSFHRVERFKGSFSRSWTLPEDVEVESIGATMEDGVLKITVPRKVEEKKEKTKIDIQ